MLATGAVDGITAGLLRRFRWHGALAYGVDLQNAADPTFLPGDIPDDARAGQCVNRVLDPAGRFDVPAHTAGIRLRAPVQRR